MNSRFNPPRGMFPGHYPTFPGNYPMGPALSPPTSPGVSSQTFCSSIKLKDGSPNTLVALQFPETCDVGLHIRSPYSVQPFSVRQAGIIMADGAVPPTTELWILGTAIMGVGGVAVTINFDIPLFQDVVAQFVCESLKVTARLIAIPVSGIDRGDFDNPPLFTGVTFPEQGLGTTSDPSEIYIEAAAGSGIKGLSNLTRRMRAQDINAGGTSGPLLVPDGASRFEVISGDGIDATLVGTAPSGAGPNFWADDIFGTITDVNPCCSYPVFEGMKYINLKNNNMSAQSAEVIWRLGLSGVES